MKLLRLGSTTVIYLILAIAAPAFAQETSEHQEQKPEQKNEKQEDRAQKKDERGQKKDEQRVAPGKDEKRGGKAARIPEDRFRASYGREHVFKVNRVTVVDGSPRFTYGGYNFVLVEPWPAGWYYTDDCYVDYIDGEYFLFDLLHPGVRIELYVVF